jgi:hypothetical protein
MMIDFKPNYRAAIAMLFVFGTASAASAANLDVGGTYVTDVTVDSNGIAFIHLDQAPVINPGVNAAACSTHGYWYVVFDDKTPTG